MKKELSILSLAMAPALAMAATASMTGTTDVTAASCTLLQDDLRIQLSNGVVGAYNCDDATTNTIYIATCHTSGRVATRTSNTVTPDGCGAPGSAACSTTTTSASGAVVPLASTAGGSMAMKFPGSTCATDGSTANGVLP